MELTTACTSSTNAALRAGLALAAVAAPAADVAPAAPAPVTAPAAVEAIAAPAPAVEAVVEAAVVEAPKPVAPQLPEIGRPEDVGLVQVATKAFEPLPELPQIAAPTRRRRSEVKPTQSTAPVQEELVMVETKAVGTKPE